MEKTTNSSENVFKSKELRRLSRRDLLLLMLNQAIEIDKLKAAIADLKLKHEKELEEERQKCAENIRLQKEYIESQINTLNTMLKTRPVCEDLPKAEKTDSKTFFKKNQRRHTFYR